MRIVFIGADHEVTGSCHYVEVGGKRFLVDCGMEQGADMYEQQEMPVNAAEIDYVFVTHAHIDHSGLLPLLYKNGFRGQIFATAATCELCNIMLRDSAHIQQSEADWKNRKAKRAKKQEVVPLYDINDAEGVLEHFISCEYHDRYNICDEIAIRFVDAGHLLGSSSIEIWLNEEGVEKKLVFSGDIGNGNRPLIKDPEFIYSADYVIMESTYGDRLHDTPPDFAVELAKVIEDTFKRGGNVVIPAFSVGRTQEVLYYIRRIKEENLVNGFEGFEVYMDSPMAVEATSVFSENVSSCFTDEAKEMVQNGHNPIRFPGLRMAVSLDESKYINMDQKSKVIISASGMCEAGRIRHHLKHNLWRSECTIVFVGFQVPGTMGHKLLNGAQEVKLFGEPVTVAAKIVNLHGMSGHADKNMLLKWIGAYETRPTRVFVVHGDDEVVDRFASDVHDATGFAAVAPYSGDSYDLITGQQVEAGPRIKKDKSKKAKVITNSVYGRLIAAGERLMAIIRNSEGMANKDLAKFADQITALCEKWSK